MSGCSILTGIDRGGMNSPFQGSAAPHIGLAASQVAGGWGAHPFSREALLVRCQGQGHVRLEESVGWPFFAVKSDELHPPFLWMKITGSFSVNYRVLGISDFDPSHVQYMLLFFSGILRVWMIKIHMNSHAHDTPWYLLMCSTARDRRRWPLWLCCWYYDDYSHHYIIIIILSSLYYHHYNMTTLYYNVYIYIYVYT